MALVCDGNGEITLGEIVDEVNLKVSKSGDIMTGNLELPSLSIDGEGVSQYSGFKNRIINSGFHVWQDTTNQSVLTTKGYGADLFSSAFERYTTGKATFTKDLIGKSTALKLTMDEASVNSDTAGYNYGISYYGEAIDIYDCLGGDITVSFKFVSNLTGKFPIQLLLHDLEYSNTSYIHNFEYLVAGVEQEVVLTIPLP